MKQKKILIILFAMLMAINLAACGSAVTEIPEPESIQYAAVDDSIQTEQSATMSEPAPPPEPEIIYNTYSLTSWEPFSEDRAWVKYGSSTALIDNTGAILFNSDANIVYCSPFEYGLSYCFVMEGWQQYTYFIIDNTGIVLSSNMNGENNYVLLGYADGHFVVAEHVSGFDANEWHLGTIDKNGDILNELKLRTGMDIARTVEDLSYSLEYNTIERLFWYAGDGIVSMSYAGSLYNVRTDENANLIADGIPFAGTFNTLSFHGRFHEGYTYITYTGRMSGISCIMSSAILDGNLSNTGVYKPAPFDIVAYSEGLYYSNGILYTDGMIVYNDAFYNHENIRGYYDSSGQLQISFPEYNDRKFIGWPFRGGYAAIGIAGADGYWYVTTIDKSGTRLYEPIKTDTPVGDYDVIDLSGASGGYICIESDGVPVIISPYGEIIKPDFANLKFYGVWSAPLWRINNGFINTNIGLLSLDSQTIINSVSIASEVEYVEEFVIPESTYTGSFDMVGTWKSESGTTLSFNADGSVGPVFFGFEGGPDGSWAISSKADENGHYTLQASHLTGGSPIYKVRLLGKDEIELYEESGVNFGRSYYYLERQ